MASVLLITGDGEGMDLANRLAQEKCLVKCLVDQEYPYLEGNPSRVYDLALLEQYDVVVNASIGMGEVAEEARGKRPAIGGLLNDKLTLDTSYQKKVVDALMKLGPREHSTVSNVTINLTTEGWFDGEKFALWNHSLRSYRLMDGERGSMTPFMGSVLWLTQENELIRRTLLPMTDFLKRAQYLGPISVELEVGPDELIFVDLNAGLLYDNIEAILELVPKGFFELLRSLVFKEQIVTRDDYATAVRLSMPPYPSPAEGFVDVKLDYPKEAERHVFQRLCGPDRVIGCCTARSQSIRELRRRVYRTISNSVHDKDIQFRSDIGKDVEEQIEQLKVWGWLDA